LCVEGGGGGGGGGAVSSYFMCICIYIAQVPELYFLTMYATYNKSIYI